MQVCTSFEADNHSSTPSLSFLPAGCPSCHPTNSIKALKAERYASDGYGCCCCGAVTGWVIKRTRQNLTKWWHLRMIRRLQLRRRASQRHGKCSHRRSWCLLVETRAVRAAGRWMTWRSQRRMMAEIWQRWSRGNPRFRASSRLRTESHQQRRRCWKRKWKVNSARDRETFILSTPQTVTFNSVRCPCNGLVHEVSPQNPH